MSREPKKDDIWESNFYKSVWILEVSDNAIRYLNSWFCNTKTINKDDFIRSFKYRGKSIIKADDLFQIKPKKKRNKSKLRGVIRC